MLKGAVFFMADLMRRLTVPCEIDFMAISSYGDRTDSSGVVRILKDLDASIAGRDVLVVEDIIDSGLTLSYLRRSLLARKPETLEVCALLTKPERREIDIPVRYVGFEIPNKFVIGYGLDYAERYRNLPYIGVLRPEIRHKGFSVTGLVEAKEPGCYPAKSVNRFFRSALFPLVVIVLLVYLASQTLISRHDGTKKYTYSELYRAALNGGVDRGVVFNPNRQEVKATLSDGTRRSRCTTRPTRRSSSSSRRSRRSDITFDSKGIGSSPWWTLAHVAAADRAAARASGSS